MLTTHAMEIIQIPVAEGFLFIQLRLQDGELLEPVRFLLLQFCFALLSLLVKHGPRCFFLLSQFLRIFDPLSHTLGLPCAELGPCCFYFLVKLRRIFLPLSLPRGLPLFVTEANLVLD